MKKVLTITGQTATGKTNLASEIAKKIDGEIVSFDSRQAYKYLDIISGKDFDSNTPEYKTIKVKDGNKKLPTFMVNGIPVWLYDIFDPHERIDLSIYFELAEAVIEDIYKRKKFPILVGGTIFYLKAFFEGIDTLGIEVDTSLRSELSVLSVIDLQNILKSLNKSRFEMMNHSDSLNPRRLIRAIEVEKNTISLPKQHGSRYDLLTIALIGTKEDLTYKIKQRVQNRIENGAVDEINMLLQRGYTYTDPCFTGNGYQHFAKGYQEKKTLSEIVDLWEKGEIEHTRKQLVFLKKMKNVFVFDPEDKLLVEKVTQLLYKWR
jgi:tRNA dimethylallyltransferase